MTGRENGGYVILAKADLIIRPWPHRRCSQTATYPLAEANFRPK